MPRRGESAAKNQLVKRLREAGFWAVRIAASPFQTQGLPDVLVGLKNRRGSYVWVEMKRPGEVPRRIQVSVIKDITAHGGIVVVADDVTMATLKIVEIDAGGVAGCPGMIHAASCVSDDKLLDPFW